jgi:hypothetical protein
MAPQLEKLLRKETCESSMISSSNRSASSKSTSISSSDSDEYILRSPVRRSHQSRRMKTIKEVRNNPPCFLLSRRLTRMALGRAYQRSISGKIKITSAVCHQRSAVDEEIPIKKVAQRFEWQKVYSKVRVR